MNEILRTDQLEIGMTVRLKSACGTLAHNDWHKVTGLTPLPRKESDVAIDSGHHRRFAARTLWLVQAPERCAQCGGANPDGIGPRCGVCLMVEADYARERADYDA